jgi:hypothetical protein
MPEVVSDAVLRFVTLQSIVSQTAQPIDECANRTSSARASLLFHNHSGSCIKGDVSRFIRVCVPLGHKPEYAAL